MKDLIKEIENNKLDIEKHNELMACGWNSSIDNCCSILAKYNLITAPKSIKLSEIVSRLENDYEIVKVNHYSTYSEVSVAHIGHYGTSPLKTIFEFNNENKIIEIIAPQFESNKWLYTLWIANVEIIDDLEELDNAKD